MNTMDKDDQIQVTMLGSFSIRWGDRVLNEERGRTKKVWMLIEYLLAHRTADISSEKIMEILWEEEDSDIDLSNSLKNLVYRARRLLAELCPGEEVPFILFSRNSYRWNAALPCTVDIEQFESQYKQAGQPETDEKQQYDCCIKMVGLYKGEFLPKSSHANWVVYKSAYYMNLYHECVMKACKIAMRSQRYDDVVFLCKKALSLYPYEEDVHKALLCAYLSAGHIKEALNHYDYTSKLFYRELNVDISESFSCIYKELVKGANEVEMDLNSIKKDLREACDYAGAFFCDYNVFKNIYQLQARSIQRTGQSINMVLITLCTRDGSPVGEKRLNSVMPLLQDCVLSSLRKSDTVARYSSCQFVALLPLTTVESGEIIMNRIKSRWIQSYKRSDLSLKMEFRDIEPVL